MNLEVMDRVQELVGRTLSPIETFKLMNILKEIPEDVVLEACMMSLGKERPLDYMFKVLYYVQNPLAERPTKKVQSEEDFEKDEWLKAFYERNR